MEMAIGLDFTSSNKVYTNKNSRHYISKDLKNPYQDVMTAYLDTFIGLTETKKARLYGFGAKLNFPGLKSVDASFCFPCSGNTNPDQDMCSSLADIDETYTWALRHIELSGPTYFSPLFKRLLAIVDQTNAAALDKYMVFLVITDGIFLDMQETIDLLVTASGKPISLLIVGVGNDQQDFEGFFHLSSLECRNSKGNKPSRSMCRFIHYE